MNIALLTDGIHPYVIGGMQKHSFQLVKYFAQSKHTVHLFHCNASNFDINKLEFFSEEEKQYIRSYVIPFPRKKYFPFHYLFESREYSRNIYESLKNVPGDIDFIYAQGFCAWYLLKEKETTKRPPVAVHFHGFEMFQKTSGIKSSLAKYFLREAVKHNIRRADHCISYGGKITGILEKIVSKDKIWEVPGSVESLWFASNKHPISGPIRFVFLGRYERRKGVKELHSAINILLPNRGFIFDFIGPIPEKYKILSPEIHYHGQVTSETAIKEILTGADILVCPSYAEGMPNVIMEAMACGLAIITTDVGAVSLLVNNDNGWLIDFPEVKKIARSMKDAMSIKDGVLEQKKISSTQKIKNYTTEKVTNLLIELIEDLRKEVSSLNN